MMKERLSRTKIIVTLGPASANENVIRGMMHEGVDVFRLNFSHGNHEDHKKAIGLIRKLSHELQRNVAILGDLQGPKIRIGELDNNLAELHPGNEIILTTREFAGNSVKVSVGYKNFARDVKTDEIILLDDGKIKLQVIESDEMENVRCRIIHGGLLFPRKGVNLPDSDLTLPSLTEKDLKDVAFMIEQEIDWIALSFVRKTKDIAALKQILDEKKCRAKIIAKIEKPEALREINSILEISDGIMVARGDLGVEMPFDQIPLIQKDLVKKCIENAKPVIIATQMMESMIQNFRPTRAEANDVANAVLDGADALMLSGETSIGSYPVEVVRNMQKIITWTERNAYNYHREHKPEKDKDDYLPNSICYNAQLMAKHTEAKALISFTHSGNTVLRVASHRPAAIIYAFTNDERLWRQFALVWGVDAFKFSMHDSTDEFFDQTTRFLCDNEYIKKGDIIIHIGSIPIQEKVDTNMMKISLA